MKTKFLALAALAATTLSASAISIVDTTTYSQSFDTLATSGTANTWANDSTLTGWHLFQSGGNAITAYTANNGNSGTGSFYSYGAGSSTERALGGLGSGGTYFGSPSSGSVAGWIAVSFVNNSAGTLSGFSTSWTGEQWRNGGNTAAQTMVFEYGFGTTFGAVSTWITPGGGFDWASPVVGSTAAAVDGNVAGLVTGVGVTITSLNWADGDTLWLRWIERNDAGNDHGLAIDDFSFTAQRSVSSVPDTGATVLLLALPLLGLWTLRRLTLRTA